MKRFKINIMISVIITLTTIINIGYMYTIEKRLKSMETTFENLFKYDDGETENTNNNANIEEKVNNAN